MNNAAPVHSLRHVKARAYLVEVREALGDNIPIYAVEEHKG